MSHRYAVTGIPTLKQRSPGFGAVHCYSGPQASEQRSSEQVTLREATRGCQARWRCRCDAGEGWGVQPPKRVVSLCTQKRHSSSKTLTHFVLRKWNQLASGKLSPVGHSINPSPRSVTIKDIGETQDSPTLVVKRCNVTQGPHEGFNSHHSKFMVKKMCVCWGWGRGVVSYPYCYQTFFNNIHRHTHTRTRPRPGFQESVSTSRPAGPQAEPGPERTGPRAPAPALPGKEGLRPENAKREALIKEI